MIDSPDSPSSTASVRLARRMAWRLAFLAGGAVLVATVLIAAITYAVNQRASTREAFRKLGSLATLQANALEAQFHALSQVLVTAAQMPELQHSAHSLVAAFPAQKPLGSAASESVERAEFGRTYARVHPTFKSLHEKFGFTDFFLIDPASSRVVYSYGRGPDFGVLLDSGPWVKTALAEALRMAVRQKGGDAWLSDFQPYSPGNDEHVAFMSVPMYEKGAIHAVLVARIPIDRVNQLMSLSGRWKQSGLGRNGETVLLARDGSLRSVSREWLTQSPEYLKRIAQSQGEAIVAQIRARDSDVGLVRMPAMLVREMAQETSGSGQFDFDRGANLVAYAPARLLNTNYQVLARIEASEIYETNGRQIVPVLVAGAASAVLLAMLSGWLTWMFLRRSLAPLEHLQETVERWNKGDLAARVALGGHAGLGDLSRALDGFLDGQVGEMRAVSANAAELNDKVFGLMQTIGAMPSPSGEIQDTSVAEELGAALADALKLLTDETCAVLQAVGVLSHDLAQKTADAQLATPLAFTTRAAGDVEQQPPGLNDIDFDARALRIAQGATILHGIAERTSILALNASMHAATAGEAGRGFSLVAVEVRRLSETSREATTLIARLVASMHAVQGGEASAAVLSGKVMEISRLAEEVGQEMQRTQRDAQALSQRIGDLAAKSHEQSRQTPLGRASLSAIEDAGLETLRKLQSQASETKRLVDYAKTLLQEVQKAPASSTGT